MNPIEHRPPEAGAAVRFRSGAPPLTCEDTPGDDQGAEIRRQGSVTGRPRLLAKKCSTCIFHPGNRMRLQPGRVRDMVETALRGGGAGVAARDPPAGSRAGGGGTVPDWTGDHARMCMTDILEEELPEDEGEDQS